MQESVLRWTLRLDFHKHSRSLWVPGITINSWIMSSCPSNADTAMSMDIFKETVPKINKGKKQKDGKESRKGKQPRKLKRKDQEPVCKPITLIRAIRGRPQKEPILFRRQTPNRQPLLTPMLLKELQQ